MQRFKMLINYLKFYTFLKIKFSKHARVNCSRMYREMNILKTLIILLKTCYDKQG